MAPLFWCGEIQQTLIDPWLKSTLFLQLLDAYKKQFRWKPLYMLQILVEFSSKTWQPKLLARFLIFFLACLVYSHSHRWCYSRWCSWLYHIRDGFETDLTSFKTIYFPLIYSLRYISGIHFTRFHRIHPNPSSDQWIHTRYKHTTTFPRASCINKRFRDRFSPTCTYTLWRKVDSVKKNNLILIDLLISL